MTGLPAAAAAANNSRNEEVACGEEVASGMDADAADFQKEDEVGSEDSSDSFASEQDDTNSGHGEEGGIADRLVAVGTALVAGVFFVGSLFISKGKIVDPLGPALFPQVIAGILFLGAVLVGLRRVKPKEPRTGSRNFTTLIVCGLFVVYWLVLPLIHFIPATIGFTLALLITYGTRKKLILVLFPIVSSVGLYFLFERLLHVILP
ncbi:MAG: tripartite tricarboxylate transporter TctB family protein [Propionibacteriaceae bacterium]|nr:tripartite tricarboxylate transporter TctB family protein [Propionibacteriaceae bacterium]